MITPIDFSTAKLLKEKGFKEKIKSYNESGKLVTVSMTISRLNSDKIYYPAPTIAEVLMWLYEKYNIWITVEYSENVQWCGKIIALPKQFLEELMHNNSPTEAYKAAILYVLTNLI